MEPFSLISSNYIELYRNDGIDMMSINLLSCDAYVGSW